MNVRTLTIADAAERAAIALGIGERGLPLLSLEGVAESLRHAASMLCPATPRQLVDACLGVLRPLDQEDSLSRDALYEALEGVVSAGDIIELPGTEGQRLLYLGPPTFVEKTTGRYLLAGIKPLGEPLLNDELSPLIEYARQGRTINLDPDNAESLLAECDLHRAKRDQWVRLPRDSDAQKLIDQYNERLSKQAPSGSIQSLTIVDPKCPVRFYRGRWREPRAGDTGRYLGRRRQEYGADRWCYVQLLGGQTQRLLDLPVLDVTSPGRDEAWRLLAARDAVAGRPQVYRISGSSDHDPTRLDVFSPVPTWTLRYLELIGTPTQRAKSALLSFSLNTKAVEDANALLQSALWMRPLEGES